MLTFGAQSPSPTPTGQVCLPVAGCLPLSGGISEGGYIVLLLLIAVIIVGLGAFFVAFRYGAEILKNVREAKHEVKNDHTKNLREDLDDKDTASHLKLDAILERIDSLDTKTSARFDRMNGRLDGVDARITGLDVRLNRRRE